MAKDPGFLFYPGDYLRDTQTLSEKAQVAYDRIMCEHMRNICIRQDQLNFFTKRLNEDEKTELMFVLVKVNGGYQIEWVAESISKRKAYSESRRKNREGKSNKDMLNTSSTYDKHMENEIENEDVIEVKSKKCLMKNSKVSLQTIIKSFKETSDLCDADIKYYYDCAMDWSDSKGEMRKDWIATIRNFARRDIKEGKLKLSIHRTVQGTNQGAKFVPEPLSDTSITYKEFKENKK